MSQPKVTAKVGKLSRTMQEQTVPASPPTPPRPKKFNEREQLAMAKALRAKRTKQLPEITLEVEVEPTEAEE